MSTKNSYPFAPDYVVPPGETLRDQLSEINLSQAELAARAGLSTKHVNQIIQGHAPITPETAIILDRITGVPASVWNRREADYREGLLRSQTRELTAEDEQWLHSFPLAELQKRGRLPQERDSSRLFDALLTFFGVANRDAYERIWRRPVASFRRSHAFASDPGAVVSWLRLAQVEAQRAPAEAYSATLFREALDEVRSLTAGGDANQMIELCARAGVVIVLATGLKGSRISGAAWWSSPTRAVIALTDRYKKDDFFWFTFFHEAAHILLHSKKETYVDDGADDDLLESEADRFSANFLIPKEYAGQLAQLSTDNAVRLFADALGIAPGIVVGRLQHDELWGWNRGNGLKRSLKIVE